MTAVPPRRAKTTWKALFRLWQGRIIRKRWAIAASLAIPLILLMGVFGGSYYHYAKIADERLRNGAFRHSVDIYASPLVLTPGDSITSAELKVMLRQAGYAETSTGHAGTYRIHNNSAEVIPLAAAESDPVHIVIAEDKRVSSIEIGRKKADSWAMGLPLVTSLTSVRAGSAQHKTEREKRRLVTFSEIPQVLVNAVVSAEDKHFFHHIGIDLPRVLKASWVDVREGRKEQGGSTLTMQLVRGLWLQPDKQWRRKIAEVMMTLRLERTWSKQQIFEAYANQVFLGRQAAYDIHGFAEGAQMLFGKPLHDLSLPEAALLAGLVQRPSYFNPYRHPERAQERRNLVLSLMRDNHYIDSAQYENAVSASLKLAGNAERDDSYGQPYFLDSLDDELQDVDRPEGTVKQVYTTLDLNLQRAAGEAIESGMAEVDRLLTKRNGKSADHAEAALIAIDPHTGEIKAMVGGRNYATSQLNRILAKRPPGSVFKPFVYAAALNTAVEGAEKVLTPSSMVDDSPVTFWSGGTSYQPANFRHESFGLMTLRQALAKSDNIAATKVAQQIGFGSVVSMARRAGLNDQIRATPSVALGAYDVTPLEMAGAWTMFANGGMIEKTKMIVSTRDSDGTIAYTASREARQVLDPRVAYLMVGMLQEVMRSGTAAGARSRGFLLPAAGKTGTSHDGWFAGFTSQLLCLVWVGFDDYRELNLEGAKSALPIWTEFMKKASHFAQYRNAVEFPRPAGISTAVICRESGKLADRLCTETVNEVFVAGSEPQEKCDIHVLETVSVSPEEVP